MINISSVPAREKVGYPLHHDFVSKKRSVCCKIHFSILFSGKIETVVLKFFSKRPVGREILCDFGSGSGFESIGKRNPSTEFEKII